MTFLSQMGLRSEPQDLPLQFVIHLFIFSYKNKTLMFKCNYCKIKKKSKI